MKYNLLLLLSMVFFISANAQNNDSSLTLPSFKPKVNGLPRKFQRRMDSIGNTRQGTMAKDELMSILPDQTDPRFHEVDVDFYTFVYAQQKEIFTWQLFSAKVILVMVITIVLMGLFLSYLQFKTYEKVIDQKSRRLAKGTITATTVEVPVNSTITGEETTTTTSLEVSKDSIKINSAVIGLIILTMSIVFFFLYLRFVFGINTESMPKDVLNSQQLSPKP